MQMETLEWTVLNKNNLPGTFTSDLQNFTNLKQLVLNGNPLLSGFMPPEIGMLTFLTSLQLGGNRLIGPLPSEIGS